MKDAHKADALVVVFHYTKHLVEIALFYADKIVRCFEKLNKI